MWEKELKRKLEKEVGEGIEEEVECKSGREEVEKKEDGGYESHRKRLPVAGGGRGGKLGKTAKANVGEYSECSVDGRMYVPKWECGMRMKIPYSSLNSRNKIADEAYHKLRFTSPDQRKKKI